MTRRLRKPGECVPLCGASQRYGRFVKPWYHDRRCPAHPDNHTEQLYGTADHWPPAAQLAVGEIAVYSGRGFGPWPQTRKACGL